MMEVMDMYRVSIETEDLVGLRIRNLRLDGRQTLAQTAQAAGVSESLLSRIENGHRRPARALVERLAQHFSVSVEDLVGADQVSQSRPVRTVSHGATAWPLGGSVRDDESAAGALVLADLAITTALGQLRQTLRSDDHVERYRACRALAKLASQPLSLLHDVSASDPDPMVREASRQLLRTLVEAYVETEPS